MATQNFLSGGYYGKLGATVGQRWKNKRTIRTYVIPHDPKTPDQIAQRTKFGSGVFYAQLAQQANYSCTFFNSESMTNWNRRMSVAVENKSLFTTLLSLIPLIPNNSVAPYAIISGTYKVDNDTHTMEIKLAGHLPSAARKYTVLLTNNPTGTTATDVKMLSATSTAANPNVLITSELADFEMLDTTKVRIVSSDDVNSSLDMVISAEITLEKEGLIPVPLDLAVSSVSQTADTTVITFTDDYVLGDTTINIGAIVADLNGKIISLSEYTKSIINNAGKLALQIVQTDYAPENQIAWGTSGLITISNLYIDTEEYHYYADNVTRTITQSGTITRSYASIISSAQIDENVLSFTRTASQIALFDAPAAFNLPVAYNGVDVSNVEWKVAGVTSPNATSRKYTLKTPTYVPSNGTTCYVSVGSTVGDVSIPQLTKIIDGVTYTLSGVKMTAPTGSFKYVHATKFGEDFTTDLFFRQKVNLYAHDEGTVTTITKMKCSTNANGIVNFATDSNTIDAALVKKGNQVYLQTTDTESQIPGRINCFFKFPQTTFVSEKYVTIQMSEVRKQLWHNKYDVLKTNALFRSSYCKNNGMTSSVLTTPLTFEFKDLPLNNSDGTFTGQIENTAGSTYDILKNATVYVLGAEGKVIKQNSSSLECVIDTNNSNFKIKASFADANINYKANGAPVESYIDLDTTADKTKSFVLIATMTQHGYTLRIGTSRFTPGWTVDKFANTVATTWALTELPKERLNPVALDMSVSSVSTSGDTTTIVFANNYVTGETTLTGVSATAELNGKTVTPVFSSTKLVNKNGKLALELIQSDYAPENQIAFGSTGSITIGTLYIDTETTHYYAINTTKSCTQSGTITRSYASTISSAQIVNNVFSFVQSASQIALFDNPTAISVPTARNTVDTGNENWSVSAVANTGTTGRKYTLKTPAYTPSNGTVCYVSMGTLSSAISIPERTKTINGVVYKLTGSSISEVAGSYAFTHNVTFSDDLTSNLYFREKMDLYYPNNSYVSTAKKVFLNDNTADISEYRGIYGPSVYTNIKSEENRLVMECNPDLYQNPARINCFFYFAAHTFTGGKSTLTLAENSKVKWHNKNNIQSAQGLKSNVNVSFTGYKAKGVTTPAYISFGDYLLSEKDGAFTVTPNTTASGHFEAVAGLSLYVMDADENEFTSNSAAISVDRAYDNEHLVFKATFNPAEQSWASLGDIGGGNVALDMSIDDTKTYSCVATVVQDGFDLKVCTPKKVQGWINEDFGTNMTDTYELTVI